MGLFMRPVTSQSHRFLSDAVGYGAGSYRTWAVIGAILIGLAVIGLAGAMVIDPLKVSNNIENINGRDSAGRNPGNPERTTIKTTIKNFKDF